MPVLYGLIALGLLPIRVAVSVDVARQPVTTVSLWIFFLQIKLKLPPFGQQERKGVVTRLRPHLGLLLSAIPDMISIIKSHITIDRLWLSCCLGFDDAAYTAVLAGGLSALGQAICQGMSLDTDRFRIHVVPDFHRPCFALDFQMQISARLGLLVHAVMQFLFQQLYHWMQARIEGQSPAQLWENP